MPSSLRPVLGRLRARLHAVFGERLRGVTLFGSYAKGDADEDSDVDVLIVIDDLTDDEVTEVAAAAAALSVESGFDVAPLPIASARYAALSASGLGIAAEIERTGVAL